MTFRSTNLRLSWLTAFAVMAGGVVVAQEEKPEVPALPLEEQAKPKTPATAEQRLVAVGEALAAANSELEKLREQHAQLKLQMEALGIAAVKGDERSLQQRLLKAAADLSASEKARAEQAERTSRLAEAAAAFMARPGEPALKNALDDALKAATGAKQSVVSDPIPLNTARVVSYKADLGLVVMNAGRDSGVRMGAPFQVFRADRRIATGLVTHVYDRIAGIFLTGPGAVDVRVGDSVKPELTQTPPKK